MSEATDVAEARRRAEAVALGLGFDEHDRGHVAIAATELSTNLLKHGGGGELLIERRESDGAAEVELVAIDRGPGMADVETCLRDGYSTAGSAGNGLGAIRRLANSFGIYSQPKDGTAVLARIGASESPPIPAAAVLVGGVTLAMAGEDVCGDTWCLERDERGAVLMVADGLGHGPAAAEASRAAVTTFQRSSPRDIVGALEAIHAALRPTRGAAVAIAAFDTQAGCVDYGGIGNIAGTVAAPSETRRMVSHNGTAGVALRRLQVFSYPLPDAGVVIMASDGLGTNWSTDRYPGLLAADPTIIAAVLYRDHDRGRDDVTVVAAKRAPA